MATLMTTSHHLAAHPYFSKARRLSFCVASRSANAHRCQRDSGSSKASSLHCSEAWTHRCRPQWGFEVDPFLGISADPKQATSFSSQIRWMATCQETLPRLQWQDLCKHRCPTCRLSLAKSLGEPQGLHECHKSAHALCSEVYRSPGHSRLSRTHDKQLARSTRSFEGFPSRPKETHSANPVGSSCSPE